MVVHVFYKVNLSGRGTSLAEGIICNPKLVPRIAIKPTDSTDNLLRKCGYGGSLSWRSRGDIPVL
jgi:hypothetical protein